MKHFLRALRGITVGDLIGFASLVGIMGVGLFFVGVFG
jgi:hypothetical protein